MSRHTEAPPSAPASMSRPALSHPFRVAALSSRKPTRFRIEPDAMTRRMMASELGLIDLPSFRFRGEITPSGARDFVLSAEMEAQVVQSCSVTLAPVPASIGETVRRRYLADWTEPEGEEAEMPEDDTAEALPDVIDAGQVAMEALALALPLYPRAPGVELGEAVFAPPGVAPLRDGDLNPFAGLAALKDRLEGGSGES